MLLTGEKGRLSSVPALLQAPWTHRGGMTLGLLHALSAALHCDFSGPGPTHSFSGIGLSWPPLARCQVSTSPARSGCGGAGGNSPHRLTCTGLEGRSACGCHSWPHAPPWGSKLPPFPSSSSSVHLAYPGGLFSRNRSHLGGGLVCSLVWEKSQITHSDLPSRLCGWFPLLWGSQHSVCPWGKGESAPESGPAGSELSNRRVSIVLPTAAR